MNGPRDWSREDWVTFFLFLAFAITVIALTVVLEERFDLGPAFVQLFAGALTLVGCIVIFRGSRTASPPPARRRIIAVGLAGITIVLSVAVAGSDDPAIRALVGIASLTVGGIGYWVLFRAG